jgi:hypothetical protein
LHQLQHIAIVGKDPQDALAGIFDPEPRGGGILRVQVNEQHPPALFPQSRGQIDTGGGLAASPLLVGNGKRSHGARSPSGYGRAVVVAA